jgi:DNA polymerase III gamma/tau subunit
MTELYKKHRPATLDKLVGNAKTTQLVRNWLDKGEVPHAILFTGDSGCGKTTVARIIANELGVTEWPDLVEVNSADFKGIESVRDVRSKMNLSGKKRVWIFDEVHKWTNDAQNAFLKPLEDTPDHVHFILCTTDPQKLLKALVNRCTHVEMEKLTTDDMTKLVRRVCKKEKVTLTDDVTDKLVDVSDGSARKALVLLDKIRRLGSEAEQIDSLEKATAAGVAFDLVKALLPFDKKPTPWAKVAKVLQDVSTEDAEGIRRLILKAATTTLLKGGAQAGRAAYVIDRFRDDYFQCGHAGLALSCWECVNAK